MRRQRRRLFVINAHRRLIRMASRAPVDQMHHLRAERLSASTLHLLGVDDVLVRLQRLPVPRISLQGWAIDRAQNVCNLS